MAFKGDIRALCAKNIYLNQHQTVSKDGTINQQEAGPGPSLIQERDRYQKLDGMIFVTSTQTKTGIKNGTRPRNSTNHWSKK